MPRKPSDDMASRPSHPRHGPVEGRKREGSTDQEPIEFRLAKQNEDDAEGWGEQAT